MTQKVLPLSVPHSGISRRRFLQAGGVGALGSILLPNFLQKSYASGGKSEGRNPVEGPHILRPTNPEISDPGISLVILNLQGGASHFDTFNPRLNAPKETRGPYNPICTNVEGVFLAEPLQNLASNMDKILILRNLYSNDSGHDTGTGRIFVGDTKTKDGGLYAESLNPSPFTELSEKFTDTRNVGYVVMHHSDPKIGTTDSKPYSGVHSLNKETIYVPYDHKKGAYSYSFGGQFNIEKYNLRKDLLQALENSSARKITGSAIERHDQIRKKISSLVGGEFKNAFDLNSEPEFIRERYGKNPLGDSLLTARKLVEAGTKVVVVTDGDYDTHRDLKPRMDKLLGRLDVGVSAFIEEIAQRGLPVVFAIVTEFGRTPRINGSEGRDHWPYSNSMLLSGYGVKGGQAIGEVGNDGYIQGESFDTTKVGETLLNLMGYARYVANEQGIETKERFPHIPNNLLRYS